VPPQITKNKETLIEYGLIYRDFGNHIHKIMNIDNKLINSLVSLLPLNTQTNGFLNCNLLEWKNLILNNTKSSSSAENKYVFLKILKDFKRRYVNLFSDIKLISAEDNGIYGIDSIDEDNWYNFYATSS
jgi:hypothetical protein